MASVAYYIKKLYNKLYSAIIRVKEYRYNEQQTITEDDLIGQGNVLLDYMGNPVDEPLHCGSPIGNKLRCTDFYTLDLNTEYTCYDDELFVGGVFSFCSAEQCGASNPPIYIFPNNIDVFNHYWNGLFYRKHNDGNNYLIYYSPTALNVLNTYNYQSNTNLTYTKGCDNGIATYKSCIFYVRYVSADELYATAPNGYIYHILKDNNGLFYVDNIIRTNNYFLNGNIVDYKMLKRWNRRITKISITSICYRQ